MYKFGTDKITSIKKLSPLIEGINYKTYPDATAEIKRITNDSGVDSVVNIIGDVSIPQNIDVLAEKGVISLVGFLGGLRDGLPPGTLLNRMFKRGRIHGTAVGQTSDMKKLSRFLDNKKVKLAELIDQIFAFEAAAKTLAFHSRKSSLLCLVR